MSRPATPLDELVAKIAELSERHAEPHRPWMLPNGTPGKILQLMRDAAREVGAVKTETKPAKKGEDAMTYRSAEEIKRAARILADKGIVTMWTTSHERADKTLGCVRLTAEFIADDGSYLEHSVTNAAHGGMGRHFTIAITAAVKVIYSLALQMATDDAAEGTEADVRESPRDPNGEEWSPKLLQAVAAIDACATTDELAAINKDPALQGLTQSEVLIARREWYRRKKDLSSLSASGYSEQLRGKR